MNLKRIMGDVFGLRVYGCDKWKAKTPRPKDVHDVAFEIWWTEVGQNQLLGLLDPDSEAAGNVKKWAHQAFRAGAEWESPRCGLDRTLEAYRARLIKQKQPKRRRAR